MKTKTELDERFEYKDSGRNLFGELLIIAGISVLLALSSLMLVVVIFN